MTFTTNQWNTETYSTHNKVKSVLAGRFLRTLKNKFYKYTISISKNVYIDKLDDLVDKYNNAMHINMKLVNVNSSIYIDFNIENNKECPKFKVGDHARMSKLKIFFKALCSKLVWRSFCDSKS